MAEALGLDFSTDEELREVGFGVQEGQPMAEWFDDWVEGRFTPDGGESFAALRTRTVRAIDRALALGAEQARDTAQPVIDEVKKIVGFWR